MMQFSQEATQPILNSKIISNAFDTQAIVLEIDEIVDMNPELDYYECVTLWIENSDVSYSHILKVLPPSVVSKITKEVLDNGVLRPSVRRSIRTSTVNTFFN